MVMLTVIMGHRAAHGSASAGQMEAKKNKNKIKNIGHNFRAAHGAGSGRAHGGDAGEC
jgi:hypothetical protein